MGDKVLPYWAILLICALMFGLAYLVLSQTVWHRDAPTADVKASASESGPVCTPSDIAISDTDAHGDAGYMIVSGTLTNNCSTSVSNVRLRFNVVKNDGTVTYREEFRAVPLNAQISSNAHYRFEYPIQLGMDTRDSGYHIDVVDVY